MIIEFWFDIDFYIIPYFLSKLSVVAIIGSLQYRNDYKMLKMCDRHQKCNTLLSSGILQVDKDMDWGIWNHNGIK